MTLSRFPARVYCDNLPTLRVSLATINDFPAIQALESESVLSEHSPSMGFILNSFTVMELEKFLALGFLFTVTYDSLIIGIGVIGDLRSSVFSYLHPIWNQIIWSSSTVPKPENIFWLERMVIRSEYRKRGVGSLLLKRLIVEAKNNELYTAVVTAPINNKYAQQFYKAHSFSEVGVYQASSFRNVGPYQSAILKYEHS